MSKQESKEFKLTYSNLSWPLKACVIFVWVMIVSWALNMVGAIISLFL